MSEAHKCGLVTPPATGLPKLSPNARPWARFARSLRKLIVVNPDSFRCKSLSLNKSAIIAEQKRHIKSPYFFMIHPFSKLSAILEVLFFIFWTLKLVLDPIYNNMITPNIIIDDINEYGFLIVQMMLIVAFFFLGYVDSDTREVIIDPKKVVWRYVSTFFLFDVIAIESIRTIGLAALHYNRMTLTWRKEMLIRYLHVLCLYVRLKTVLNYLDEIGQMLKIMRQVRRCMVYTVRTYMYLHFFCCLLYFVPTIVYHDNYPPDSWVIRARIGPKDKAPFYKIYGECFMLATCYFFGASSGRYVIRQTSEEICVSLIAVIGRLYTLYLLADVLSMFGIVGLSESNYEKKIAQLKEYMVSNDLPRGLRNRMVKYYEYKLQKKYFNESQILGTLSEYLRAEIFIHSARTLLQKSNVFKFLQQRDISDLISMMRRVTLAPGDVLFKPDQVLEDAYFVCSGTIAILNRSKQELIHLEDGEILGLMQFIFKQNNYYGVVLETTDVYTINAIEFFNFLDPFPMAQDYMRVVARERYELYKRLEENAVKGNTCLMELRSGRLLEKMRMRKIVAQ